MPLQIHYRSREEMKYDNGFCMMGESNPAADGAGAKWRYEACHFEGMK
jgi:hypothetical protein